MIATELRADAGRISADLDCLAGLSVGSVGVSRLAYSPLEREAHSWFRRELEALGLTVRVDAAGNTIGELAPTVADGGPAGIGTGSHLDSVPQGGRFDGIAGVVAGVEVARLATASDAPRRRPWRIVAFAAEEGARFGQACNGSRMIAGKTTSEDLRNLTDKDGVTMYDAMAAVGLEPDRLERDLWKPDDWAAFVELHVEQGTVLERNAEAVGVVDVISGSTRLLVTVSGVASHSGGTPMRDRHDALSAAAECVLAGETIANDHAHHGTRVTIGRFDVLPGSITTIPGQVIFSVDVRDTDSDRQRATAQSIADAFAIICARRDTSIELRLLADTSPVHLDRDLVDLITSSVRAVNPSVRVVTSGASHDSQQLIGVVPVGMIFVPSRHGLSHVPEEFTEPDQLAHGVDALLAVMRRLDAR